MQPDWAWTKDPACHPGRPGVTIPMVEEVIREVPIGGQMVPVVTRYRPITRREAKARWGRFGRTGAAHMAQDAADLAVDSLTEAGLLVTPEMTAVLEAAECATSAWRDDMDAWPDEVSTAATTRTLDGMLSLLAAAVDALEARHSA